jgi:hypothetical protein
MDGLILLTGAFCSIAAVLHFASIATVIARLHNDGRLRRQRRAAALASPASIFR